MKLTSGLPLQSPLLQCVILLSIKFLSIQRWVFLKTNSLPLGPPSGEEYCIKFTYLLQILLPVGLDVRPNGDKLDPIALALAVQAPADRPTWNSDSSFGPRYSAASLKPRHLKILKVNINVPINLI